MGIIPIIKHAVNSTLGTGFFTPLDKLLGAKIACRGTMGTKFKLTRTDGYFPEKTVEITEASRLLGDGLYVEIVPVPLGAYSIEINAVGMIMTVSVEASAIGEIYTFSYSSYQEIARFTSNGTLTVPAGVTEIFVDAAGGGGGGGCGGYGGYASNYGGASGGGGGGYYFVQKARCAVSPLDSIQITIGKGGEPGARPSSSPYNGFAGSSGSSTLIGSLLTIRGGYGGGGGKGGKHTSTVSGGGGGADGGKQGEAGTYNPYKNGAGGAGGVCPLGRGNGGAGSAGGSRIDDIELGQNGGNGIAIIYKGVCVE